MKKYLLVLLFICWGCSSANIPAYLQSKNPYEQRFFAGHDKTLAAIIQTVEDLGWVIEEKTDPIVYEQREFNDLHENDVLIITATRQTPLFLGTRYARLNVYLRSKKNISEVEIRYLTVTSVVFKNFKDYRNDSEVRRIFDYIDEVLNKPQTETPDPGQSVDGG